MKFKISRQVRGRCTLFVVLVILSTVLSAQDLGSATGELQINGVATVFPHAYVFNEEHPFNEGEQATVIKLTTEAVSKRDLGSPFAGGSTLTVRFGQDGDVYGRDLFLRSDGGMNSISGLNFEFTLDASGPEEYRGSIGGTVDYFDDQYVFDIRFATAPLPDTGEPLPADGGEPGKAYLAHFAAMTSGDIDKIRSMMPKEKVEAMDEMGMSEAELLEFIKLFTPSEVTVVGGELDGNMAYVEVTMVMEGQPGAGTITMENIDGRWYVLNEAWRQ